MSADSAIETSASTIAVGRSHNPFTGAKEVLVFPETGALADKVRAELEKNKTKPVEVEVTEAKITVRPLRRTAQAAVKIALDLLDAGAITNAQALNSVPLRQLNKLMTASIADFTGLTKVGSGMAAAPGITIGKIATSAKSAIELAGKGEKVILKVSHTTPEDMEALKAVVGIVAETGGYTSHSAVVARQMGKPCIVSFEVKEPSEGTMVTMDGSTGLLYLGEAKITETGISDETKRFVSLANNVGAMQVFANADTAEDVEKAIEMGAAGIGLCRTEHTFFTDVGIKAIRRLILSQEGSGGQTIALTELYRVQKDHFKEFFAPLSDIPVTIRLLDPPMHEFLPSVEDKIKIKELAKDLKLTQADLVAKIEKLKENNPMLGHRGCRLGLTFKGLYATQVKAILRGMYDATFGVYANPKTKERNVGIMIPLISNMAEMRELVKQVKEAIEEFYAENGSGSKKYFKITVGAMLETPRACLITHELAEICDFFSFGTNDLTQTTWALSRDDAKFMVDYKTKGIVATDPFESLDIDGVGQLMDHAVAALKDQRSKVKIGICGEHGGDPESIEFCNKLKLDYVSCSPSRIRLARLAAAMCKISGQISPEIEVQEVNLAPIVVLEKKPAPAKAKPAPDADKAKAGKSTYGSVDLKKTDFSDLNKTLGTWATPSIPTIGLAWKPLDIVVTKDAIVPEQQYWYVKYHTLGDEHVIGITDTASMIASYATKKLQIGTIEGPGLKATFEVPTTAVCAVAQATDLEYLTIFTAPVATATNSDVPVTVIQMAPAMSIESFNKLTLEQAASSLAGKFVKIPGDVWCKVIGEAPNPYQTYALAALLPASAGTSPAADGPLKAYLKIAPGMTVDEIIMKTKLKYLKKADVLEISNEQIGWK